MHRAKFRETFSSAHRLFLESNHHRRVCPY
jgi:hypothetical protein